MTGCWQILSQWLPMATYWLLPLSVTVAMTGYWQFLSQWLPIGNFIGYCPCQWQSPWLTTGSSCHNDCLWQLYWLLPLSRTVAMTGLWQFLSQWLPMATLLAIAPVSESPWLTTGSSSHNDCLWQNYWLLPLSVTVAMTGYWQFFCHNDCLWQLYWLLPLSVTVAMTGYWQSLSQRLPMATLLAIAPVSSCRHDWLLAVPVTMTAYGNFIGYCPCQ